jgi:hypothetical protein
VGWVLERPSGPVMERPASADVALLVTAPDGGAQLVHRIPERVIPHRQVLSLASRLVRESGATCFVVLQKEVLAVRDVRILISAAEQKSLPLSATSRQVLEDLNSERS